MQNVAEGKTDIAAAPFILPFLMSNGVGPYAGLGKEAGAALAANLAALYTYRISVQGLYAYDSSGISGWDGIEGKTIYNGPPRGAALTNARLLIKTNTGLEEGTGYTGVQVNWGQAVKTIQDGSADAFVLPMSFPDPRVSAALASGNMTIFSTSKEVYESEAFQNVARLPGTVRFSMPVADMGYGEGVTIGMLGASYISEKMGLMSSVEREKHDAMVTALQPAMFIENPDCMDEVLDKIHHDNKRGYLPERVGFVPMILAKKCGEIHKPNDMYLEYVPDDLVEEAVTMILEKFLAPEVARGAASRRANLSSVVSPQASAGRGSPRSRL